MFVTSFVDAGGEDAAESDAGGRLQPATKGPSVRQIAAAHEILTANGCLLSVGMIALKNAHAHAQQVLQPREHARPGAQQRSAS